MHSKPNWPFPVSNGVRTKESAALLNKSKKQIYEEAKFKRIKDSDDALF